jgi:hypothetical protein
VAVLDLGVAKVAGGLVVVERRERHARAAERVQKPGFRPSSSPPRGRSAHRAPTRSRSTSARPHVATTNVSAIARYPGQTARPRSPSGSLGSDASRKVVYKQMYIRQPKVACHAVSYFLALKNTCMYAR